MCFHKITIRVYSCILYIILHITNVIIFLDEIHKLQVYINDLKCTFSLRNLNVFGFKNTMCSLKLYKSKSLSNLLQKLCVNSVKS